MDARTADTYQLRKLAPTDLKAYEGPLDKGIPPSIVVVKYAPFDVRSQGITYSKRVFLGFVCKSQHLRTGTLRARVTPTGAHFSWTLFFFLLQNMD